MPDEPRGYQPELFKGRPAIVFVVCFFLCMAVIAWAVTITYSHLQTPVSGLPEESVAPRPRLLASPAADRILVEREAERLTHYGWIDRSRGEVYLPIDRAMDLVLQEGIH